MKIRQMKNGLSLVPETDFEAESLGKMFIGNEQRKVIVKTGSSLVDVQSVDIIVSNEKPYIVSEIQGDSPKKESIVFPGSILDHLAKASMRS